MLLMIIFPVGGDDGLQSPLVRFSEADYDELKGDYPETDFSRHQRVPIKQLGDSAIWLQTLILLDPSQNDYCVQTLVANAYKAARLNGILTVAGAEEMLMGDAKTIWSLWTRERPTIVEQLLQKLFAALRPLE